MTGRVCPWYRLNGHEAVPVENAREWGAWFETSFPERVVKQDTLPNGRLVSTVFLAIDYSHGFGGPPQLFESMIFAPEGHALAQDRCATWEEAEIMHAEMVKRAAGELEE